MVWSVMSLVGAFSLTAAMPEEPGGSIRGVVRFTGAVPEARLLPTGDGGFVEHFDLVVDPKSRGLKWVIATLVDAPPRARLAEKEPVVIDQKDMLFQPRVVAVQEGRAVRFENSDPVNHNVSIVSAVRENELNLFVSAQEPVTRAFVSEKRPLRVGCTLHPSMTAWIHVAPHPWAVVSDAAGAFELRGVPPGKYTLWLVHPDSRLEERRSVEVKAGQATRVEVEWKELRPRKAKKKQPPASRSTGGRT